MKNKKKNRSSVPSNSSGPPRQPPYHFVQPPMPFYPPPPWSAYPGVWHIPPLGPPPAGFPMMMPPSNCPPPVSSQNVVSSDSLIAQHPHFGFWPHPGVYTSPPTVFGPVMPQTSVQGSVVSLPTSAQAPTAIAPSLNPSRPTPPLRRRPTARHSASHDCGENATTLGDSPQEGTVALIACKVSQGRCVKNKKHNDMEKKSSRGHDKQEADVYVEHKSLKEGPNTVEHSEGEESNAPPPKLGSEPFVGLRFGSEDQAYEFYNAYAKEKGFSIRKSHIQRSRVDRSVISREYVCANQGVRSTNDRRYKGKVVRPRRETRVDCRAVMSIKRRSERWVIDRFHKEHNHGFVDPVKAEKLRSHRKLTSTTKSVIDTLHKCRIGPSKIIDVLAKAASGEDKVEIGVVDLIKFMKIERKNNIGMGCYRVLEYFQGIRALDLGFFYAIEAGENRSMRSIFWADSRARAAYKQFGDVIVLDFICRSNRDLFPFASFTGINHHRQAVLFGCGFLADETVESFIWLFQTFLRAMSDRHPTSVITNRDKAVVIAIEKVFPEAKQMFCRLHVDKSFLANVSNIFDTYPDFQAEYRKCVYGSQKPEDFESGWKALLARYCLNENSWLNGMHDMREHWVPLYLQDTFFAGMTTLQLGEGMNYFDGFLHDATPLNEFIPQYEQAVKQRRNEEADEDFMTMYTSVGSTSKHPIEEQAARVFTRNMFTVFSHEFCESSDCLARKSSEEEPISKYLVGFGDKDDEMNTVIFDSRNNIANCSCHMFEFEGMLCKHVLKVFQEANVVEIPPKYILNRWTMNARYVGSTGDGAGVVSQKSNAVDIWTLKSNAIKFVELGAASTERLNCAFNIIEEGMKKLSLTSALSSDSPPENFGSNSSQGEKVDDTTLHVSDSTSHESPPVEKKHYPESSKMKLGIKQTQRKKRKCSACNQTGHYTSTCPQGSVIQSETSTNVTGSS